MSDTLPPLPEPIIKESCPDGDYEGYTADQMRAYALAARQQAQVPDPCLVVWQAMNEAEKVGNRTDDKLIVEFLRRAGYIIAAAPQAAQPEQAQQSERQRFEAWFSRDDEFDLNPAWGNRTREGKYTFPDVQEAWEAWQAARASILARLEAVPCSSMGDQVSLGWNKCRAAMLAAAKVKDA